MEYGATIYPGLRIGLSTVDFTKYRRMATEAHREATEHTFTGGPRKRTEISDRLGLGPVVVVSMKPENP